MAVLTTEAYDTETLLFTVDAGSELETVTETVSGDVVLPMFSVPE
jgi:hypothetical protein